MIRLFCAILLLFPALSSSFSQSVEEIKADLRTYLWGEGSGSTLNKAH